MISPFSSGGSLWGAFSGPGLHHRIEQFSGKDTPSVDSAFYQAGGSDSSA